MTTKEIKGEKYLFATVPEGLKAAHIETSIPELRISYELGTSCEDPVCSDTLSLPEGIYTTVGLASELTEAQWEMIVERHPVIKMCYKYYLSGNYCSTTARDSGFSLVASIGRNPQNTLIIHCTKP